MNNSVTTVTPTSTGVVIEHVGCGDLHLHFTFTVVAASDDTIAKLGDIQGSLKGSAQALSAATAASK